MPHQFGRRCVKKIALLAALGSISVALSGIFPTLANARSAATGYVKVKLVSDLPREAKSQDLDLVNPWGLAHSGTGPWWVANNGTGVATIYDGHGNAAALVVGIPGGGGQPSAPTGEVFNGDSGAFTVSSMGNSGSAAFLFVGEDGAISGWSPAVNPTNAVVAVDNSTAGAVYKGAAIVHTPMGPFLLATNFHSGLVEAYNGSFQLVAALMPTELPDSWSPFNVRVFNGTVYVTFAKHDAAGHDEIDGPGLGLIYTFDMATRKFTKFVSGVHLNAPWGLAVAPSGFGQFAGDLLVGNFGDGHVNAYDPATGAWLGMLTEPGGMPVEEDGLWALEFGNDGSAGPHNRLYFTAGLAGESHGEFGYFEVAP